MTSATASAVKTNPWLIAFVVSLATFMEVLDTTIVNVSLPHIGGSLSASHEESTWILSSYLVSNAIILPLSGWLSMAIGRKKYFMLCIAAFTLASFFCGAASGLGMMIVFRLLQGIAGGGLQPTQQAILLDTFPIEKRAQAYALTGITMIVAPVVGPTLGGYITDNFDWRWIFFINIPVGLFALFMVNRAYHDHDRPPPKSAFSVDYFGLGFLALGIGALQIVLDKGQQEDWFNSSFIIILSLISALSLLFSVWWLLRQENPLVALRLLKLRSFSLACIMIFFMGFVLYSSSILLPLLVQTQFGYDAMSAGLILSPGALAVIFVMPVVVRMIRRYPPKYLIAFGFFLCSAGMFYTMNFSPETNLGTFIAMRIVQVMGLPFLFIPISTMAFMDVPRALNDKASALFSLSRNLGGSFGIALIATYLSRHTQSWQTYLAADISPYGLQLQEALAQRTAALIAAGASPAAAAGQAQGMIYHQMQQQASFLAYGDSFQVMSWIMLLLVPLALMMPGKVTPTTAH
ncbi:MAG: DHA2 family efflux MFS transporter permease subunit [Pseudomonadota bacterium]